jgi:protein-tyrosine phosphatase
MNAPPEQREAHRLLPFKGTLNFRDLGGYQAGDGRRVRWGALYRSGHLHKLGDRHLPDFRRLNLKSLIDLRSQAEARRYPNRLPEDLAARVIPLPIDDPQNPAIMLQIADRVKRGNVDGFDPHTFLLRDYQAYALDHTPTYRRYLHELLAAAGEPVLFHCTAGKDRTGFAAALTLRLLGVPQETIFADYLLTNRYIQPGIRRSLVFLRLLRGRRAAHAARQLSTAKTAYLDAAFDAIQRQYGSFEAYTRQALDLSPAHIETLRANLLGETPAQNTPTG